MTEVPPNPSCADPIAAAYARGVLNGVVATLAAVVVALVLFTAFWSVGL